MNKVILIGRTTKDIELKKTKSGKSACMFGLAVKREYSKEDTDFINLVAFNKTAELLSQYVKKGNRISVIGRLEQNDYTDKDGKNVSTYNVVVDNIEFLEQNKKETKTEEPDELPFG